MSLLFVQFSVEICEMLLVTGVVHRYRCITPSKRRASHTSSSPA